MSSAPRRAFVRAAAAALAFLVLPGCSEDPVAYGTLAGHVTIGPLVPVVRDGEPEPEPTPEMYAARKVVVRRRNGRDEIARIDIGPTGDYGGPVPEGVWTVDINRIGADSAAGLPAQVEIRAGEVTRLDIAIDTGIR